MKAATGAVVSAAALLLAACGSSPPTHFFSLNPVPPAQARAAFSAAPVRVAAVHMPSDLDRLDMVSGVGGDQLVLHSEDQWAAPLDDMSRRVLAQDLAQRLPEGLLVFPHSPKPKGTRDLVVDVQTFGVDPLGQGVLQASWTLLDPGGQLLIRREVRLRRPAASAAAAAQAEVMSGLLGSLADRIAAELASSGAAAG